MWANLVVMFLPGLCLPASRSPIFKHFTVHELVPDVAVEALGVSILPGTARFDTQRSYPALLQQSSFIIRGSSW